MTNLQKRISSGLVLLIALAIVIKVSLINITLLVLLTLVCLEFLSFFKNRIISLLFISAIIATFILNYYFSLLEIPYFFIGCIIWIGLFTRILLYDNPNMSSKEILCAGYLMIMPSYISGGFTSHTYPKLLLLILLLLLSVRWELRLGGYAISVTWCDVKHSVLWHYTVPYHRER